VKVLVAPDSFKGSLTALDAAQAMCRGWQRRRPDDELTMLPIADGGEGSLAVLETALPSAEWRRVTVTGPGGQRLNVEWLMLADGVAVVELASCCGMQMHRPLDPLGASTAPLGELIRHVVSRPDCRSLVVCLGGSASTDGGVGALVSLGARALDVRGNALSPGGGALIDLAYLDLSTFAPAPPEGVLCLSDVDNPLLGPRGAAYVFAPQKGAGPKQVELLEGAMGRLQLVTGGDAARPGMGAAGGTAFGLATAWGATVTSGSDWLSQRLGLDEAVVNANWVLTGEGSFDSQSLGGKAAGRLIERARARGIGTSVIAGHIAPDAIGAVDIAVDLTELSGSLSSSILHPRHWVEVAARHVADTAVAGQGTLSVRHEGLEPPTR
jgi:glycerate kinase